MNIFSHYRSLLIEALKGMVVSGALPEGLNTGPVTVEPPRDPSHGDLSTNVAMVLAKQARQKPRDLADLIAPELEQMAGVDSVEVAGPGFINIRLGLTVWQDLVSSVLAAGEGFGSSDAGAGEPVNIEYVSANPTGPMHVGHTRGAVFGDALANLLSKVGYSVTKEYYINDAGGQIDVLARSAFLRYREALGEEIGEIPEGLYPGDYLIPVGEALKSRFGGSLLTQDEDAWLEPVRDVAAAMMMDMIRADLAALGVRHDVFFSEKTLHSTGRIVALVDELKAKGHIYDGILEPPKGKLPEDYEEREQTLFRATAFGDDVDRPLQKSNGDYTYFAADIAYHHDKYSRGFKSMIDVWGADHGGYVKRVQSAIKALSDDGALDVKLCQLVRLFRDGEPVKMSKRAGTFITLREVVEEVGRDVVRFIMLTRKNDAPLDFDFAKVTEQSKDNPVFYVQYAHARICSVIRKADREFGEGFGADEALKAADLTLLSHEGEITMIKRLAEWPRLVLSAAQAHEPHRIAFYLYDLASALHAFWNRGNDDPSLRFIVSENAEATRARLALVRSVAVVLASGLSILGVEPAQEL